MFDLTLRFLRCQAGAMAVVFGVISPVLLVGVAVALDMGNMTLHRSKLQSAADAAALAAASELLTAASPAQVQAVARSMVAARFGDGPQPTVEVEVDGQQSEVTVEARMDLASLMGSLLHDDARSISARATGSAHGEKVCVIALEEKAAAVIDLDDAARLSASECSVYSNSTATTGMRSVSGALIEAARNCSAGGVQGSGFYPPALIDCPPLADPLKQRMEPAVASCLPGTHIYNKRTVTLSPGTYCGGLQIHKDASVFLLPGIYVIKDGPLIVGPGGPVCKGRQEDEEDEDDEGEGDEGNGCHTLDRGATLKGEHVSFYFTGDLGTNPQYGNSVMRFEPASVVELSAPKNGPLAGILLFEDRTAPVDRRFEVLSVKARKLVGTIYLPRGRFVVDTDEDVSQDSAYTAIVTNRMMLRGSPRLFLNTDYHRTDVPVPQGVGPAGTARLTK